MLNAVKDVYETEKQKFLKNWELAKKKIVIQESLMEFENNYYVHFLISLSHFIRRFIYFVALPNETVVANLT